MNKFSLLLTALMTLSMVFILAPSVFAMNRGKVLRNIAIWLAIFVALGYIYQNFGLSLPGAKNDAATMPVAGNKGFFNKIMGTNKSKQDDTDNSGTDKSDTDKSVGDQGFMPPKE